MNRQQALNQLRIMQAWHEDFGNGPCPDYDAICYAINIIEEAPEGLDNLIKALEQEHNKLLELQKAQPEIIRCKDCQHSEYDAMYGDRYCHHNGKAEIVPDNHYCGYGEGEPMSDLIDRQAAIDIVEFECGEWSGLAKTIAEEIKQLPSAEPERTCVNCGRTANNGGWYADGRTRCPIEEHYALPKDGYCHLWEKRNVTDDDYPERREE